MTTPNPGGTAELRKRLANYESAATNAGEKIILYSVAHEAIALAEQQQARIEALTAELERYRAGLKKACESEVAARKVIETSAAYILELEAELRARNENDARDSGIIV